MTSRTTLGNATERSQGPGTGASAHAGACTARPRARRAARALLFAALAALFTGGLAGCKGMYEGSGSRTVGEVVDDSYISAAINKALLSDPEVSFLEIDVDVSRGVVTLNGNVTSAAAEQKVVSIARGVRGVSDVRSRLIVLPGTPRP